MSLNGIQTLQDIASRYKLSDVFDNHVACFTHASGRAQTSHALSEHISFYQIVLVNNGTMTLRAGEQNIDLRASQIVVFTPYQLLQRVSQSSDVEVEGVLIETRFFESMRSLDRETDVPMPQVPAVGNRVYELNDTQLDAFRQLLQQVRMAIRQNHVYKTEIIKSLLHVCLLFINELPYQSNVPTHDFKHKENIFKIFIHLAHSNFKRERQIRFYADKLNITTTYLSRTVREVSGATVGDHLSLLTYGEACQLLRQTDMTIGEISDELHFADQSAFTKFFKARMGISPLSYRNGECG